MCKELNISLVKNYLRTVTAASINFRHLEMFAHSCNSLPNPLVTAECRAFLTGKSVIKHTPRHSHWPITFMGSFRILRVPTLCLSEQRLTMTGRFVRLLLVNVFLDALPALIELF